MDFKSWIFLIENRIFSEISEKEATLVKNWYRENESQLPFSDIFGPKKTRLVIPVENDPEAESILDRVKSMNATMDFSSGLISIFDERTNKYRPIKLGKFLLDKKSPFTEEEKKWWNSQGNPLQSLKLASSQSDYSVIISRHPIDLLRMSDHDNWTSCHGPEGDYFHCALAESKGSGAIAYVIKKSDLARVNLDDDEIFEDKDRRISGVSPLSRVRIRKFVHKEDGYDLAVPENRVYGVAFPGFLETVRSWSLDKQQPKIGLKRPRMKEFELRGGSYRDTAAGTLFNYFFGDEEDRGDADYSGEEEGAERMADVWDDEVQTITARYEDRISDKFFFHAEVDVIDDQPYVSASSGFSVPFSLDLMKKINKDVLSKNLWEIVRKIRSSTDLPEISSIEIDNYNNNLNLNVYFDSVITNPDEYDDFLSDLARFNEEDIKKITSQIYDILLNFRAISSTEITDYVKSFEDDMLAYFDLSEDDSVWSLELKERKLIVQSDEKDIEPTKQQAFSALVMKKLQNWADQILQMKKRQKMLFDPRYVNFYKRPFAQDFAIKPNISLKNLDQRKEQPPFRYQINLRIDFREIDKNEDFLEVKEFVEFIDKNFEQFEKLVSDAWFAVNK